MAKQLAPTEVYEFAPERKMSDVLRDSRTLARAITARENARKVDFYEALSLFQCEFHALLEESKVHLNKSGWSAQLGQATHKTISKFLPEINSLTIQTIPDFHAAVDRHDLYLLNGAVHSSEREAGRNVTLNLLNWLTDLAKF